ncbi:MAG TPA: DUF1565 domain-containing protein [Gemmatimonadota bacterium]|jgi:hypothetical protein
MSDSKRGSARPEICAAWRASVLRFPLAGAALAFAAAGGALTHARGAFPVVTPGVRATVYHVKTTGSDTNPGTESRPFQTVQRAVTVVQPGDTIRVHAGTYQGIVDIRTSGTEGAPIVLEGAGDGEATLTADFRALDCSETYPTRDRTVQINGGADYWTIRKLSIVNGIVIIAPKNSVLKGPTFMDHSQPGHGSVRDQAAAEKVLPSFGIDPSDYISLLDLDVRGRGLLTIGARHGELANSRFHDIDCGTGAAVWINRFSDFWHIHDNDIRNVAASKKHYMSEGIRLGSGSSYAVVERNVVEHMAGLGRGITSDVGASWNVYRGNRVNDTSVNFSEQAGGWGNQYVSNLSQNARRAGYMVFGTGGMDEAQGEGGAREGKRRRKGAPPAAEAEMGEAGSEGRSGTPKLLLFECNDSQGDPISFQAGDVTESTFTNNNFAALKLSDALRGAWNAKGNAWNGSKTLPPERPSTASFASCTKAPAGR